VWLNEPPNLYLSQHEEGVDMIRRSTLFTSLLAVLTGIALFVVKYQVQDFEGTLTKINREISDHRQAVHVLKAEWSHLNEPNRLRYLTVRYLDLGPLENAQFTRASDLSEQLTMRVDNRKIDGLDQKIEYTLKKGVSQ
jgi:hypothetical protein